MASLSTPQLLERMDEGVPKLWTIHRALKLREEFATSFDRKGAYTPIPAEGEKSNHIVAFLRGKDVAVITPRLSFGINNNWQDTSITLADGQWTSALSGSTFKGGKVPVQDLFSAFPIELLSRSKS